MVHHTSKNQNPNPVEDGYQKSTSQYYCDMIQKYLGESNLISIFCKYSSCDYLQFLMLCIFCRVMMKFPKDPILHYTFMGHEDYNFHTLLEIWGHTPS